MLFNTTDINEAPVQDQENIIEHKKRAFDLLCFESYSKFAKEFPEIKPDHDYHIINYGTWSMHELVLYLVNRFCGPSELWVTTWSINENVVQSLVSAKTDGKITDIHFLFDYRVKKYRPGAWYLAQQHFDCVLTSCHAKVTVIQGQNMSLTILGSANYNRNNRIEAMILMPGNNEATNHKTWIANRIAHAKQ